MSDINLLFSVVGLSLELLKTETNVSDHQLDGRVEEADLPELAACFDNTEDYVEKLQLTPGQQTDVRAQAFVNGTQAGMKVALKCWRNRNSVEATFRTLLLILLSLLNGDVAVRVCKYLANKCEYLQCTKCVFRYFKACKVINCDRLWEKAHLAQVINFYFIALLERAHFLLSNAL